MLRRSSFAQFANAPAYMGLNKTFVERVFQGKGITSVVDLGCEAGVVTALIAENLPKGATIIGIDPSGPALRIAERNLQRFDHLVTRFVKGNAEQVSRLVEDPVDAVFFSNAIHLIRDKVRVVQEISTILKPGGAFAFSTAFFRGAEPEETLSFYRAWMFRALRSLRRTHNLAPRKDKAAARIGLTEEGYCKMLEDAGFVLSELQIAKIDLPLETCLALTRFEDFVGGVLPGIPLEVASEVLEETLKEAFEALSMVALARNWLLIIAARI
jgi:ubiquinone/menaquinone biosynthesis C-methylase UbiE